MQYPPLTLIVLIFRTSVRLLDDCVDSDVDFSQNILSKMFKYIQACKEKLLERWKLKYLLTLCERQNCANGKSFSVVVRDIVQIKGEQKNR